MGELRAGVKSKLIGAQASAMSGSHESQAERQTLTRTCSPAAQASSMPPSAGLKGSVSQTMREAEPQSTVHAPSTTTQVVQPCSSLPSSTVFAPAWKFVV